MKLWSEFYDYIFPQVPGADAPLVDLYLRESAIEFFENSQAWRWDHPQIAVTALTAENPFVPPDAAETEVHVINYAEFDDEPIGTDESEFRTRYNDWRNLVSQPEFVIADQQNAILVPIPNADGTLDLKVSLKPTPVATGIYEDLQYNDYRMYIAYGALYRLMEIPKKPYTNDGRAKELRVDFNAGIAAASIRVELKYTNAQLETGIHTHRGPETKKRFRRNF